jgi:hypothetical protein
MTPRTCLLVLGCALCAGLVNCGSDSTDAKAAPPPVFHTPRLQGTFFSKDTYNDGQWRAAFEAMKAAGLTQAIVNASANATNGTTRYPTSLPGFRMLYPTLPQAFPNAGVQNVDMYLGLQSSEDWWSRSTDPEWMAAQATLSNQVADELEALYGQDPCFKGWYLPFEVDNVTFPTSAEWDVLVAYYTTVVKHLHDIAPGKPVLAAPFFNPNAGGLDAEGWRAMWAYILAKVPIDVLALQDGVGAGNTTVDDLPDWYQATKSAIADAGSACKLWSDTETFQIADESTMPIADLVAHMKAVEPYVANLVSWSFNDYLDPHAVNPFYFSTYYAYVTTGTVDAQAPTVPRSFKAEAAGPNDVTLTWLASEDDTGVVAYDMNRNGTVTRLHVTAGPYGDSGLDGGTTYTYTLAAVDAAGNVSAATDPQTVATPSIPDYPTNLALNRPYTASSAADDNHPDVNGTSLTDGVMGSASPWDSAWQGRTDGGTTWVVDLGSVQTIHEISSGWLCDPDDYILMPTSIAFSVSADGVTFTPVGTAVPNVVANPPKRKAILVYGLDVQGRYVRVEAATVNGSWSFTDEIEVRQ